MPVSDIERFRTMLLEERDRVQSAIEHLQRDHEGSLEDETGEETAFDQHPADAATATFGREMDYTLEENSESVLNAIEAALVRIEAGTYGSCQRCGKEVAEERLEAVPYAELCIDCKREVERG